MNEIRIKSNINVNETVETKRRSRYGCAKKWRLLGENCMIIQFEWTSNDGNEHTSTDQRNILSDRLSDWILLITFGFVYFIHRQRSSWPVLFLLPFARFFHRHIVNLFFFFHKRYVILCSVRSFVHLAIRVKHNGAARKLAFKTNLFSLFNWHLPIVCLSFYKWKRPKQFMNQIKSNSVDEKKYTII